MKIQKQIQYLYNLDYRVSWAYSRPSEFICWNPKPQYLTMCLYLQISSLRRWLSRMRPSEWAFIQSKWYPYKKRKLDTQRNTRNLHTQKKNLVKKVAVCKPRSEASEKAKSANTLSWTSNLQNYEKVDFCYLGHPVCGILLCQS